KPAAKVADKPKADEDLIQGTWKVVSFKSDGKDKDADLVKDDKLFFKFQDGQLSTIKAGKELQAGSYKLDAGKKPKAIDFFKLNNEKGTHGIYQLDGDGLKLCFVPATAERPSDFASKEGSQATLLLLERDPPSKDGTKPKEEKREFGQIGVQIATNSETGKIVVKAVLEDSPAAKAGFQVGDVILKVGDVEATDLKTVVQAITGTKPGTELTIQIEKKVTVVKRPD